MGRRARTPLSRERIVEEAAAIVADEGHAGWSMRGLARRLGVEPMSLYYWFPSRDHVMDGLFDRFVARLDLTTEGAWEDRLRSTSRSFRAAARQDPALFPYVATHRFNTRAGIGALEAVLGVFATPHPEPEPRAAAFRLWTHWMVGFLLDETSGFAKGPSAQDPPTEAELRAQFPYVAALGPYNRAEHFDALFETGLDAVLTAIRDLRITPRG